MKIYILTAFLNLVLSICVCAQSVNSRTLIQDSLTKLISVIWKQKSDSARLKANSRFFNQFRSVLESEQYLEIALDSIGGITRVASDDGLLRIFTWNVPLTDGSNKYFGLIQLVQENRLVIPLQSTENQSSDFYSTQFSPQTWYGAIYYKLIQVETGTKKAYTLLGWDGYTSTSNRKIIDIIYFDNSGNIIFGMPVFKTERGIKYRVVFEYAEKANMLLRYDFQAIRVEKRNKIKKEPAWLIVMDRLVPMDPSMKGMPKYYVPSGDTYDGYIFKDGYWVLVEDIEVANKEKIIK
jgi:hypothetical protein